MAMLLQAHLQLPLQLHHLQHQDHLEATTKNLPVRAMRWLSKSRALTEYFALRNAVLEDSALKTYLQGQRLHLSAC